MAIKLTTAAFARLLSGLSAVGGKPRREHRAARAIACLAPAPALASVERSPGRWVVVLDHWHPCSDNVQRRGHWSWYRAKRADLAVVAALVRGQAGVPKATGKRRLGVRVEKRGKLLDGSNINKSLRDSAKSAGLIVDDDARWLEGVEPVVVPGAVTKTIITIEDVE